MKTWSEFNIPRASQRRPRFAGREDRCTRSFSHFVIDSPYARILACAGLAGERQTGTLGAGYAPSWSWHSAWWGMLP